MEILTFREKFIGSKDFYARVFAVALPIMVQNVITTFVNLLDNIMVGQTGTEPMSGVAIVNQLLFVVNLGLFGMVAGIGIFTAQYHGKGDETGERKTFRIKLLCVTVFITIAIFVLLSFGDRLIWLYLHEGESGLDLNMTFEYAKSYLSVIVIGLPFFGLSQAYASTLRETGHAKPPMRAGIIAVFLNLVLNYILIYGKLGFPALGVIGAAIATNISRAAECLMNMIWAHSHKELAPFTKDMFSRLDIKGEMLKQVFLTAAPLFANEILWSSSQTVLNQIMSQRGIEVVPSVNISSTAINLFLTLYMAMGNSLGIIVGHALGKGDMEEAVDTDRKIIALISGMTMILAVITFISAPAIANIYNTTDQVKHLATTFIRISAVLMPMDATVTGCYFTMRCGGKTMLTFLFDCCYAWAITIPIAFALLKLTDLNIIYMYAIIFGSNIIKFVIGVTLVKKRVWVNNLVGE